MTSTSLWIKIVLYLKHILRGCHLTAPLAALLAAPLWTSCADSRAPAPEAGAGGAGAQAPAPDMGPALPPPTPAGLALLAPPSGAIFGAREVQVRGAHPTAASVTVNGVAAPVQGGAFEVTLTLDEGAHAITAEALGERARVDVMVDLTPPTISIDAPTYGEHLDSSRVSSVTLSASADDALSGVARATVNGVEVAVEPTGALQYTLAPTFGLNVLRARVEDRAGHAAEVTRSFLYGRFKDWSAPVNRGAAAAATPYALDALEQTIARAADSGLLADAILGALANNPNVTITSVEQMGLVVDLEPRDGYLAASLRVFGLRVRFEAPSYGTSGDVYVDAALSADLRFAPTASGALDVRVESPRVEITQLDVRLSNALAGAVVSVLEGLLEDLAEQAVLAALEEFLVGALIDPSLFRPTVSVLGTELQLALLVEEVSVTPDGVSLSVGFGIDSTSEARQAPGYLFDPNTSAPERVPAMISASLQRNTLHLLMGQAWRAGLLDVSLLDLVAEPPAPLRAAALAGFTGGALLERMGPTEVVGVRLRPSLPPVARFEPTDDEALLLDVNDLLLDLTLPTGEPWLTLGLNLTTRSVPAITANALALPSTLTAEVWPVATPLFPVDTARLIGLLKPLLETLPTLAGAGAGAAPLLDFSELELFGVQLTSVGIRTTPAPNEHALLGLQILQP